MNVSNKKCIRYLSAKSMKSAHARNLIAIIAIALTTVLFTSLFTVSLSINYAFQQANFRQVGGYSHGGFKNLTWEQVKELKNEPLIKEYGLRLFVGIVTKAPFNKSHVEVSYCDRNMAKLMYMEPTVGSLPKEGTNEAATDTRVLSLLGIKPRLGTQFTISIIVDGQESSETFTLCGWWEYDEVAYANNVLISQSLAENIFEKLDTQGIDGMTGFWSLNVLLNSALHIEQDLGMILENHGYQFNNKSEENYIGIGVNWGYSGAQLSSQLDPETIIVVTALLLIIIFTGYLIIYNVFQISVAGDIRHYGLLKTIGTTGRQIKRIIRLQAIRLSVIGIPIGLLTGFGVGAMLVPVVFSRMSYIRTDAISTSPLIFFFSAIFSLITIFISCSKPGKIAARVSPVEAVRYVEAGVGKRKSRKANGDISLLKMASANLGRNRRKAVVTIISLSLSVVLLNLSVTFTNGFDMDKYLADKVSDYIIADASYFQVGANYWSKDEALAEEIIDEINIQEGVIDGGRIYGLTTSAQEFITEEHYRQLREKWYSEKVLDEMIAAKERTIDGRLIEAIQLYGMEEYAISKLTIFEGDLSKLNDPSGRYIAAVCRTDDYGEPVMNSYWAKVGDIVTFRHIEVYEYYDLDTGEILEEIPDDKDYGIRAKKYRDIEYEVVATVFVPHTISYRYYGMDEFVMSDRIFIEDTGENNVMMYIFDASDEADADIERFLKDFTTITHSHIDYESKLTYVEEFYSFRNMFLMLGGLLSFIVCLVGVLNFLNAVLTGILARRREFAVLQAIGMTGRQLKIMLIWEGLYYTLGAILGSFLLCIAIAPLLGTVLDKIFWFFSYRFTIMPIIVITPIFAVLGVILPVTAYYSVAKRPIVERLREVEG